MLLICPTDHKAKKPLIPPFLGRGEGIRGGPAERKLAVGVITVSHPKRKRHPMGGVINLIPRGETSGPGTGSSPWGESIEPPTRVKPSGRVGPHRDRTLRTLSKEREYGTYVRRRLAVRTIRTESTQKYVRYAELLASISPLARIGSATIQPWSFATTNLQSSRSRISLPGVPLGRSC